MDPLSVDPELYELLKDMARRQLRGERAGHTLQPTALVHEAWLRLPKPEGAVRVELLARAATAMRRVLVDHARRQLARRRGARAQRITLDEELFAAEGSAGVDILALDDAMHRLAELDARQARIVELRFFGGLTAEEAAESLGVSRRTVQGDWNMARAFLRRELARGESA